MNITLSIPDAVAGRAIDALTAQYGYQATINGAPNPQTKAQFAKGILVGWVKDQIKQHEGNAAAAAAGRTALQSVETDIVIT